MGAVAQDNVQQFNHGYFPAIVSRNHTVERLVVTTVQKLNDVCNNSFGILGDFLRRVDAGQALAASLHIVSGHAASLVAQIGQLWEGHDVDDGVPKGFRSPGNVALELIWTELHGGAYCGVQNLVVFVCQPSGPAGQVNLGVKLQGGDELSREITNDYFVVDHSYRGGLNALAFKKLLGSRFAGDVVVLILNTVGREKLFQRPATESTRVGVNVYAGHGASPVLDGPGMLSLSVCKKVSGYLDSRRSLVIAE